MSEIPNEELELAGTGTAIDPRQVELGMERLRMEQSFAGGVIGGLLASLVGAAIWAGVTVATGYQIGFMAIGVGFLAGIGVRTFGKGIDGIFGVTGAVFALFGCLLGNFLAVCGFIAVETGVAAIGLLEVLDINLVVQLMVDTFSPIDVLFYAIAVYEGYRFSMRDVTEQDLLAEA